MKKNKTLESYDRTTSFSYFLTFFRHKIDNEQVKQVEIAREIGVRPEYVNKVYKGKQTCSVDVQEKICRFFGITYLEALAIGKELTETGELQKQNQNNIELNETSQHLNYVGKGWVADQISDSDIVSVITHWANQKKETEDTLNRLQNIIENLNEGVVILNSDLVVEYQNRMHREMFGAHIGKKCSEAHKCDHVDGECPVDIAKRKGMPVSLETQYGDFIVSTSTTPIRDFSAKITGYVSVIRDISRRLEIEKSLQNANEILEKIFSTTHLCIAYLDNQFNFIKVNRAYADADGHSPEFFIGKNHFDLYPNKENEEIFQNVVKSGKPITIYAKPFEYPGRPELGKTYWDWTLSPVFDREKNVEALLLILHNVTKTILADKEKRLLEEEWQKITMMSQQAMEMLEQAVFIYDDKLRIRFYNSKLKEITGAKEADLKTIDTYRAYISKNNLYKNYGEVITALDNAREKKEEVKLHVHMSSGITYSYTSKPIYIDEDTFIGRMVVFGPA